MPKLHRVIGKECIAALKKIGFEESRQKGSHVILKMGEVGCVVPMHTELRTGTLHGLLNLNSAVEGANLNERAYF